MAVIDGVVKNHGINLVLPTFSHVYDVFFKKAITVILVTI